MDNQTRSQYAEAGRKKVNRSLIPSIELLPLFSRQNTSQNYSGVPTVPFPLSYHCSSRCPCSWRSLERKKRQKGQHRTQLKAQHLPKPLLQSSLKKLLMQQCRSNRSPQLQPLYNDTKPPFSPQYRPLHQYQPMHSPQRTFRVVLHVLRMLCLLCHVAPEQHRQSLLNRLSLIAAAKAHVQLVVRVTRVWEQ